MSLYIGQDSTVAPTADDFVDPATLDDPIEPIAWRDVRAPDGARRDPDRFVIVGLLSLFLLGLAIPVVALIASVERIGLPFLELGVAYVCLLGLLLHRSLMRGPSAWIRAIARRSAPFTVDRSPLPSPRADVREATVVRIDLGPPRQAEGRSFDPGDPAERAAAQALYRARIDDGLALENASTLQLVAQLLDERARKKKARVADWMRVTRWLAARTDRRRAWLSAMAWSESSRWSRAARAIELLDADDETVEDLYRRGSSVARIAAATHAQRADRLEAMLADQQTAPPVLIQALTARLTLDHPPIDDWLADPRTSAALVTHAHERLEAMHWLTLIGHPNPGVATRAAGWLVDGAGPHGLTAARTLVERMDLRAHTGLGLGHPVTACVARCLSVLSRHGDASDLLRIGGWADVNGMNAIVQRRLDELRAHLVDLPEGGGLALSDMAGGELGLAEPMPGRLALTGPADPTQPEEP